MSDLNNNVVAAIQGNAVSPNRPTDSQWLIYNNTTKEYEPSTTISQPVTVNNSFSAQGTTVSSLTFNGTPSVISSPVANGQII
jgi:hypothetical protein